MQAWSAAWLDFCWRLSGMPRMRCFWRSYACARVSRVTRSIDATADQALPMNDDTERDGVTDRDVLEATLRFNTLVFSIILGVFAGAALLALSLVAYYGGGTGGLAIALIGVLLPGYGADWSGALLGLFWGFLFGALLGVGIYRINSRHVLDKIDDLVIAERGSNGFPRAVL